MSSWNASRFLFDIDAAPSASTTQFVDTNFLEEYDNFPKSSLSKKMIQRSLRSHEEARNIFKHEFRRCGDHELACVRLWTANSADCYPQIQQALFEDDAIKLREWMPVIRGINGYITRKTTRRSITTYRGSKMSYDQAQRYKIGSVVRIAPYCATSRCRSVAKNWSGRTYLVEYRIPTNCYNARDISKHSRFPDEKEVLLPPFTAVRVEDRSSSRIVVSVLDNMEAERATERAENQVKRSKRRIERLKDRCAEASNSEDEDELIEEIHEEKKRRRKLQKKAVNRTVAN